MKFLHFYKNKKKKGEIKIKKKGPHLYQFQVRVYNNILLPPPERTNCKNYTIEEDRTLFQKHAISRCLFDRLSELGMVYFPNSINISWIVSNNLSIFLNKRPQYNGLNLDEGFESENATAIFEECSAKFDQPDCIEIIYLVQHLPIPIKLDSTVFYDDGVFRYDKEFMHLIKDELDLNETELIKHDKRKYLYSVFQLVQPSYPLFTNKFVAAMDIKEYILLMASVYGAFTNFRVSQLIKRLVLWTYSAFFM